MQTKVEKKAKGLVKLTVTLEPSELVKYFNAAYEKAAPSVKLDGFRPGKAPRKLIESSVGVTRLLSDGLDQAINESYMEALRQENITPVSSPAVKIEKYPAYGSSTEEIKTELVYEAELTMLPEVKVGDYSKIKIEKPVEETVKDDDIKKVLDNLLKQKATFVEIDRHAKLGDLAEISYEGMIKKVKIDGMASKNHPLVLGEKTLIPGFEDEIVGMKKGEKKTFKIKFPKDYHSKMQAGKEAEFEITLNDLKEVKMPELDDAFAETFGQKNIDELKKAIKDSLAQEYEEKNKNDLEQRIIDKMLPLVKVDLPDAMIDREVERMFHDWGHQLEHMKMDTETYLKTIKKTVEDVKREMRPVAEKNIKVGLLLGKIIEEQEIDHHDDDAGRKAIEYLVETLTK